MTTTADQIGSSPYTLQTAELEWPQPDTPEASAYGDIYFSKQHGLEESRYVFLQHNHLEERWQQLTEFQTFTIGETGFGTGLNFLNAWHFWQQTAPSNAKLHFISVEKHPLTFKDLQRALSAWPELESQAQQLLTHYPTLIPGQHIIQFDEGRITLHLLFGEAINGFEQLRHSNHPQWQDNSPHHVDAWFLDGFAPAKNPSMWNSTLYSLLADLSHSGTTLATFTAVGAVRRGLAEQGFVMEKATGYGKKREMLLGCFDPSLRQSPVMIPRPKKDIKVPWYVNQDTINLPNTIKSDKALHIAIIGGGLAGTGTANALAKRGCKVTLLERENALAQGASGNPQGMLYTKLSARMSKLNQFTLSSYLFALRYYQQWQQTYDINNLQKDFCGVLQLASSEKDKNILSQLKTAFATHPQLVQFLNPEQASEIAGVTIDQPSCWFPQAGWISPTKVCETLTNHDLITKQFQQHITDIVRKDHQWLLLDEQQQSILSADIVVIANSSDAKRFSVTKHLPLKSIRGQISLLPANTESAKLNTVICHEGYITPAIHGRHSLGATYSLGDSDTDIRTADHQTNLDNLQQALPSLLSDENYSGEASSLDGRASLRCSTLDYLPLVGPVHNHQQFITDYDKLRKNALMDSPQAGTYLPGLYLNVGHGSRGLTSTPLCSELLASMICSEPPPLPRVLTQALNPARFVIRNLIRNKC